jgi:hypothetical protein
MGKQRRISVLKFLYGEDAIDNSELSKVQQSDVGVGIKVNGGHPIAESVQPLQVSNNNIMLMQDAEYTRRIARELTGFSRNQFGEFDTSSRRTATEASLVGQGSDIRMGRKWTILKDFYTDAMRKINSIVFQYWRLPKVQKILGDDGVARWVSFTGNDIKGEYAYEISFVNSFEENPQQRAMRALQLYSSLSQDPSMDQTELKKFLVRNINDPDITRIFTGASNANLPVQMQQVPQGGGSAEGNEAVGQEGAVP